MKHTALSRFFAFVLLTAFITGCTASPTPPTQTPEPAAPTADPIVIPADNTPEATETAAPTQPPLPGDEVVPLDSMGENIPWLPMENTDRPGSVVFLFNLSKPPFTNALVRRAFAAAIDRDAIARIARDNGALNPTGATTFTPPQTLGRDLFSEVGVQFHPSDARKLLSEAGYTNLDNFPAVTLMTNPGPDNLNIKLSEEMIRQWSIYLGVTVTLEVVEKAYFDRVNSDPTEIYWSAWAADYNDPDNFLMMNFHTGTDYNYNHFSNVEFDDLVDRAGASKDPVERQDLYIQAERILCEQEVALIPVYHTTYNIP